MASKSEVLRRAPVCVRWAIHPGARASRPHPYSCKQPAIQGHSLARRTKPAFTGFSSIAGVCAGGTPALPGGLCAGETPALPGGLCAGETPALPGGLSSRAVVPPPRAWPKAALMAVTTIKSTDSLEVESVRAGGVGTSLDGVEVRSVAAGSCLCSVGNPPGSAGVPPASLYLQTACHPRPLPCKAHQTRLYGVLFHRAGVCAGETPALPGGLCAGDARAPGWSLCGRDARAPGWGLCGRDARAPGWGLCGRDARAPGWGLCGRDARAPGWSLLLPPARPLAGPSRASSNALVALWPFFVPLRGNLFLSLGVLRGCPSWISYVSWLCSSATISRATSRPRSGWPGGREMAATTGWPPPP